MSERRAGRREAEAGGAPDPVDDVASAMSFGPDQVRTAVAYYADHREEIDARISVKQQAADEMEASWRRQQEILTGSSR